MNHLICVQTQFTWSSRTCEHLCFCFSKATILPRDRLQIIRRSYEDSPKGSSSRHSSITCRQSQGIICMWSKNRTFRLCSQNHMQTLPWDCLHVINESECYYYSLKCYNEYSLINSNPTKITIIIYQIKIRTRDINWFLFDNCGCFFLCSWCCRWCIKDLLPLFVSTSIRAAGFDCRDEMFYFLITCRQTNWCPWSWFWFDRWW